MYDGEDYDDRHYRLLAECRLRDVQAEYAKSADSWDRQRERLLGDIAEAWQWGYTAGNSHAMRLMSDEPGLPHFSNPYRLDSKA